MICPLRAVLFIRFEIWFLKLLACSYDSPFLDLKFLFVDAVGLGMRARRPNQSRKPVWAEWFRQITQAAVNSGSGESAAPADYKAVGTIERPPLPGLFVTPSAVGTGSGGATSSAAALIPSGEFEVPFPVTAATVAHIRPCFSVAPFGRGTDTVVDPNVRNCLQLNPSQFRFSNPAWEETVCGCFPFLPIHMLAGADCVCVSADKWCDVGGSNRARNSETVCGCGPAV